MKKASLSLLSVLFTAILVNAQDITSYRGAFAPAPEPQWTDSWTNWDPQNAAYGAATATITAVNVDTTWTTGTVIKISGIVYVATGKTLTIQPGVIVRGDETVANSSLFVTRGAKLIAIGTACNPIVFTSNKAIGARAKADWGGVVLLGSAKTNTGTNQQIEGTSAGDSRNFFGGTNDNDNSGTLKYVRIEFGGFVFAANSEINGLTMGAVGRGTSIEYVQVSFVNDDAFEWFGGTVNCKHLVAYRNLDDDFDTDNGFSGVVQYCLGIKDPAIADAPAVSTSEGFESDNDANATPAFNPKTSAKFYNVTQIGAFRCASNASTVATQPTADGFRRGARLRRITELKIFNSILMNNWRGLLVDAGTLTAAQVGFQNNIISGDFATSFAAPYTGVALAGEDAGSTTFLNTPAFNNTVVSTGFCDLLVNPWTFANPDFRPKGAALLSGATSGPGLTVIVEIDNALFTANQATDFLVDPFEQGTGATNGTITITIPKPSGWNITVPSLTLTGTNQQGVNTSSNVSGGTANTNSNWNFRDDGTSVIITSRPGVTLAINDFAQIGLTATRKGTTSTGTNQNLGVFISGGGDTSPADNSAVTAFSAN